MRKERNTEEWATLGERSHPTYTYFRRSTKEENSALIGTVVAFFSRLQSTELSPSQNIL